MSSIGSADTAELAPNERLEVLFDEVAELVGQRNAVDARLVEIVAEIEREQLWGSTGARSITALVAWKTGMSPSNADTIVTVAQRLGEFPRCAKALHEGQLSLDQVGVIAHRAAAGSDAHYAKLAASATVTQLRTAIKLAPRPEPDPKPAPQRSITKTSDAHGSCWRIRLDPVDAATFDAALQSHLDALIAEWRHDHDKSDQPDQPGQPGQPDQPGQPASKNRPPFPTTIEAFMRLIETGWDTEATRRPHGHHTTVVMHLDVAQQAAALHLGPLLTDAERQYLTCDATFEAWFERDGEPIGAGRTTRAINRRLRRALQHRHPTCAVPGVRREALVDRVEVKDLHGSSVAAGLRS